VTDADQDPADQDLAGHDPRDDLGDDEPDELEPDDELDDLAGDELDGDEGLARVEKALADRFPHHMVPDLARMRDLLDLLGQPQRSYPSIHLTGTNGKTSTARMIDALLRSFGIRPGRYTSPHLVSVTERISLDGEPASAAVFARAFDDVIPYVRMVDERHEENVTFFELLTAMGFAAFADAPVDAAVVEVGMGGEWDATNVLDAPVVVITPISLDHRELGDSVAQVAREKSGIIHEGATVILAEQPPEADAVIAERCALVGATLLREGEDFGVLTRRVALGGQSLTLRGRAGTYDEIFLPLHGEHQAHNAACALAAVEAFLGAGDGAAGGGAGAGTGGGTGSGAGTGGGEQGPLAADPVRDGFAHADSPGRLEVVGRSPAIILDGAHNVAGAQALAAAVADAFTFDRLVGVVAVLGDKDAAGMLRALEPVLHTVVVAQNDSPRALPVDVLARVAVEVFGDDRVVAEPRLDDAVEAAVEIAEEVDGGGGGVLVTGSLVTVGQARAQRLGTTDEPAG